MDTKKLEKFAQNARRQLHEQVGAKLERVRTTDSAELRAKAKMIDALEKEIRQSSREAVVEKVAYTWFNRFIALRYMDVNHYTRVGAVSPAPSHTQPEILQEAKQGHVDGRLQQYVDEETVFGLLSGRLPSSDPQQEAYRLLLVGVCNYYHTIMPFMFEEIDDYTELLMPDDLLSEGSILHATRQALTPENCEDVEVIGWLYQFYISEKKDEVIKSKKKIQPEDIPAATQLFTPHWIVRYLVENSLGRLWLLNHPDSRLVERMDYYIEPEQEETDYLRVESPEELTVSDPAAGSGHMLTYAFDLLYAIYEEQGYNPTDIPRLILEKNVYGTEIDERAGALAAFALMMKARDKDRRFFRRGQETGGIQPNVIVLRPISFEEGELEGEPWLEALEGDQRERLLHDLHLFKEADNFGSLLQPQLMTPEITRIRERVQSEAARNTLFAHERRARIMRALDQAEYLARKTHVVAANPPYMGRKNMNSGLKKYLREKYKDFKADLFAAFVVRITEMTFNGSFVGIMTPFTWMFLSSYEELRAKVLDENTLTTLVRPEYHAFFDSAYVPVCAFTLFTRPLPRFKGVFIDLDEFYGTDIQHTKALEAINNPNCDWLYRASAVDFRKIPGSPIAYSVSNQMRELFRISKSLSDFAPPKHGMTTGNNSRFLRLWYEAPLGNINFAAKNAQDCIESSKKWFPYNKGGGYRKWFGYRDYVINYGNLGEEIKAGLKDGSNPGARIVNEDSFFKESITWGDVTSGPTSFRYCPEGAIFDGRGSSAFPSHSLHQLLAILNSPIVRKLLAMLNPTLSTTLGDLEKIPVVVPSDDRVAKRTERLIEISRQDWDSVETSWEFSELPLLKEEFRGSVLSDTYFALRTHWCKTAQEMQQLEEENNRIFIEAYGLQDELGPDVRMEEITLTCNPHYRYGSSKLKTRNWANFQEQFPDTAQQLADIAEAMAPDLPEEERLGLEQRLLDDTMREFISYAVGCMFGRYSLDKPGLILANQGETFEDYVRKVGLDLPSDRDPWAKDADNQPLTTDHRPPTTDNRPPTTDPFLPDRDNVIPMLEGDWFTDDVAERFKRFLRVTFGEEHYEENVAFIEAALNRDIRGYFLRNFYDHHVRMYSKRPIYWLFSSPKGSFNALIYMHRYRPDTVSVVLNDYLREFRTKLTARKSHLQQVERSAGASKRDKTAAVKEIDRIDKILNELQEYEDDVLYPLATQQVDIDLDDGVLVNYNKFGKALAHVRGLSGKA